MSQVDQLLNIHKTAQQVITNLSISSLLDFGRGALRPESQIFNFT